MLKKIFSSLILGFGVFVLIYLISTTTHLFVGLERGILNGLFYLREPAIGKTNPYVSDRVHLLGYDEDSIAVIGKWPWKRYVHAEFLDKIQRFSPEIVFFDIIFASPESVPKFISEKFRLDPATMERIKGAFTGMDEEFAKALARYENVYIDQQLVEEQRESLPEAFRKRIALNEKILEKYSQPAGEVINPVTFNSLEPVLTEYVKNAHPAVINILPDEDGVIRLFPLFFTYRLKDGSYRNIFTVALLLLQQYFHIENEQITLREDRVVFNGVKAPMLDPDTKRTIRLARDAADIIGSVSNSDPPPGYAYNTNLYRYLLYRMKFSKEKAPLFPIHLLERIDGGLEIVDGWEIYDAARDAGAVTLYVVPYQKQNLVIRTPVTGFYRVNYAGRDEWFYEDPNGQLTSHHTIPTEGYRVVYETDDLVDIPKLDADGKVVGEKSLKALSRWYQKNFGDREKEQDQTDVRGPKTEEMFSALLSAYNLGFSRYYNKFVFTGGNATGLGDVQQTPYAGMFGVNVIINAFNTIATDNPLIMSEDEPLLDAMLLGGLCLLACLIYGLTGIRTSGILFAISLVGISLMVTGAFWGGNLFISTSPLVFADTAIFISILGFKLLTEEKDKRFIKETFGTYLAPELIQEMHHTRTMPTLGGEAKVITAFFTDIQGFSTFSEKLTAHQLVDLLNEYLTAMTDILIRNKGTLDKYEGDAIIAFFGAPMELLDHEVRACRVAVQMQQKLGELREKWQNEKTAPGDPNPNDRNVPTDQWNPGDKWPRVVHEMRMRIGINTGEIVVGNMGSATRMNYTMMGDPVNLSARLEAAAKQYGVYNLVSEYTLDVEYMDASGEARRVMDMVEVRYLDRITVVGKSEPVRVYELFAMKGEITDKEMELIRVFEEGMAHYRKMQWDKAIDCFSRSYSLERFPFEKTTPSDVFIYRCREFKKNPPVESDREWDGVFRLTQK